MTKETKQEIKEPSENALLAEYQACQDHHDSLSTEFWAVTAIMMSISVALLGGILFAILSGNTIHNIANIEPIMKVVITVLGIGMGFILAFVMFWLKRLQFMQRVFQKRMREIEKELKIKKNWLVHGLDLNHSAKKGDIKPEKVDIPAFIKEDITNYSSDKFFASFRYLHIFNPKKFYYRYESPLGSQVMHSTFATAILFWLFLIEMIWGLHLTIALITVALYIVLVALFIKKASKFGE